MVVFFRWAFISAACFAVLAVGRGSLAGIAATQPAATAPATAPVPAGFAGWADADDNPTTPGYHKLVYKWDDKGIQRQMPLVLYIPEGYDPKSDKRWPLLVFLSGIGERGADPAVLMNCGIPVDLAPKPEVLAWLPMIMVFPLCPADVQYDDPQITSNVVTLVRASVAHWPVDAKRLYLTGLSMGGRGCWAIAREAPDLFAVVNPIVARELQAADTAKRVARGGTTFLVISGMADPASEPATRKMVDALLEEHVDVVYVPVPRADHRLWPKYYSNREFYEWLLIHERGKAAPTSRPSADHLMGLFFQSSKGSEAFREKLQAELSQFAPHWFIDNCAPRGNVGLKPEVNGVKNVFVTVPLVPEVACRLQTTTTVPVKGRTCLKFRAGRNPQGEWNLVVRINEQEVMRSPVNSQTAKDGWLDVSCDLTRWQGQEARVQIIHEASGWIRREAYWADLKFETR